jgi:hypothetical protein
VLDLDPQPDGLYAIIRAGARADAMLASDPSLPLSATISENYQRADNGEFFPASLTSVNAGSAIGLSNPGGQLVIDLSRDGWAGEQPPGDQLTDAELAELLDAVAEADQEAIMDESDIDIDQVIRQSLPLGNYRRELGLANDSLARFSRVHEMSVAREQARLEQDSARPAGTAEERLQASLHRAAAGALVPAGQFAAPYAREFSVQAGAINGGINCGATDELTGLCLERYHSASCGSLVTPDVIESLRPAMQAAQPVLDADGMVHRDAATGSAMTWTDMAEWNTGVRLADKSLFESGRAKREVVAPQRSIRFGDPDSPADEEAWAPVSADTKRTAARLAAQAGLPTSAGARAQQAAWKQQHQHLQARIGKPGSPDYAEHTAPARQAIELAQFEGGMLGSLPSYSRAGAVSGVGDEVFV